MPLQQISHLEGGTDHFRQTDDALHTLLEDAFNHAERLKLFPSEFSSDQAIASFFTSEAIGKEVHQIMKTLPTATTPLRQKEAFEVVALANARTRRNLKRCKMIMCELDQPYDDPSTRCYRCGYSYSCGLRQRHQPRYLGPYNKCCCRTWAAGVIVCFIDATTEEPYILLGDEGRTGNSGLTPFWGFGEGHETSCDQTAARECFEESLGLFGTEEWIEDAVANHALQLTDNHFAIFIGMHDKEALHQNFEVRKISSREVLEVLRPLAIGKDIDEPPLARVASVSAKEFSRFVLSGTVPEQILGTHLRGPLMDLFVKVQDGIRNPRSKHTFHVQDFLHFCSTGSAKRFKHTSVSAGQSTLTPTSLTVAKVCSVAIYSAFWSGRFGTRQPKHPLQLAVNARDIFRKLRGRDDEWAASVAPEVVRHWLHRAGDSIPVAESCAKFVSRFLNGLSLAAPMRDRVLQAVRDEISLALEHSVLRFARAVLSGESTTVRESCRVVCGMHFVDCLQLWLPRFDLRALNPGWDMANDAVVACAAVLKDTAAQHPGSFEIISDGPYDWPFLSTVVQGAVRQIEQRLQDRFLDQLVGPSSADLSVHPGPASGSADERQRIDRVPLGSFLFTAA